MSDDLDDYIAATAKFWRDYSSRNFPLSLERTPLSVDEANTAVKKYREQYGTPE